MKSFMCFHCAKMWQSHEEVKTFSRTQCECSEGHRYADRIPSEFYEIFKNKPFQKYKMTNVPSYNTSLEAVWNTMRVPYESGLVGQFGAECVGIFPWLIHTASSPEALAIIALDQQIAETNRAKLKLFQLECSMMAQQRVMAGFKEFRRESVTVFPRVVGETFPVDTTLAKAEQEMKTILEKVKQEEPTSSAVIDLFPYCILLTGEVAVACTARFLIPDNNEQE